MCDVPSANLPYLRNASLFASGRDALVALVRWGAIRHGWRRVWVPSYYCPEVPAALAAVADVVELLVFPDHALWAPTQVGAIPAIRGDVVVLANQLGVRPRPDTDAMDALTAGGVILIEDHSHDLGSDWALRSGADYAFASLRKTLPLPDGGAVWSPRGLELPPEPADTADSTPSATRRLGQALAAQLGRSATDGAGPLRFRALARSRWRPSGSGAGEGILPISRALLPGMPAQAWRERRRRHLAILEHEAELPPSARLLQAPQGGVGFAFTMVFATHNEQRKALHALAARAVAPVVLWPLDTSPKRGVGGPDADLSRRILSIHCDQRYEEADMHRLGVIVREALHPGR